MPFLGYSIFHKFYTYTYSAPWRQSLLTCLFDLAWVYTEKPSLTAIVCYQANKLIGYSISLIIENYFLSLGIENECQ
jgi:predicted N-acyltransferase